MRDLASLAWQDLPTGRHARRCRIADEVGCDVVILRGHAPGPTLLAVGAVHGDEYEGPAALARLAAELEPAALRGTLLAIPVLNEPAHLNCTRCAPDDGRNLARVFPGAADGTVTERIAAAATQLLTAVDAFVDLHAAGTFYTLHPWAGYGLHEDPDVLATQRRMAVAFGLDFVWGTGLKPGRSLSAAAQLGVPAIYVEMTGSGLCRAEDVARDIAGVRQAMAALDMLDERYPTVPPRWFREADEGDEGHLQLDHPAPRDGIFQPSVPLWDEVSEGRQLGTLSDPGGGNVTPIRSLRSGRVAMLRTAPPVRQGEFLAVVVPV